MLPPDPQSFKFHLQRANYQAYLWYTYSSPDPPPSPLDHGLELEAGLILPVISKSPPMPDNLKEILQSSAEDLEEEETDREEGEEEEEEEEEESDGDEEEDESAIDWDYLDEDY